MERTEVNVTTKICLHDVLVALDALSKDYPMDRLAEYQIERIEGAARILRERMKDYEEEKNKTAPASGTITPVNGNFTMPSGWSYSIQFDKGTSAPAVCCKECYDEFGSYSCLRTSHPLPPVTERRVNAERRKVWDQRRCEHRRLTNNTGRRITDKASFTTLPKIKERRELGIGTRRKVQDASNKYLLRTLNMYGRRSTDKTPYNAYPVINVSMPVEVKTERRVNAPSRRKVNDYAQLNRTRRIASYGPNGRRSTDRDSYTMLPAINVPPPVAEAKQDRTKRRK